MLSRTRQRQYNNIIKNAKAIFVAKGINDTSMNDIARQAGIERKTIYNYFNTKVELATAVVMEMSELDEFNHLGAIENEADKSGYEMLEHVVMAWADAYPRYADALMLEYQYETIYKDIVLFRKNKLDADYLDRTPIGRSIKKGIADKSIHYGDMDMLSLVVMVIKCLKTIIQKKLINNGDNGNNSNPCMQVKEAFKIILRGLKASPMPQGKP